MGEKPIPDVIYLWRQRTLTQQQSRKVTSSERFICYLHIFRKEWENHIEGGTRKPHHRVHGLQHQRLRKPRCRLQILDTRMGLLIIIVLPATCLVEKLSCKHMIYRIYHHITEVTRESHPEWPWFASHDEAFRVVDVANHGNENGILLSLPQCDDWLFFSHVFNFW